MELKDYLKQEKIQRLAQANAAAGKFMLREKIVLELRKAKMFEVPLPWYRRKIFSPMQMLAGSAAILLITFAAVSLTQLRTTGGQSKESLMPVEFTYYAPNATNVELAGDFAGWQATKNRLQKGADGNWRLKLMLPAGRYQYQFVIDGAWKTDPSCPARVSDDFGRENSLLII